MTHTTIKKVTYLAAASAASFALVASSTRPAEAASLVGPPNNLQGIDGLQIGSTFYDIRFRPGSFNSTFDVPASSKPEPTFLNNSTGASNAVNAINTFFNSIGFGDKTSNPQDGILGNISLQYLVPFLADTSQNGNVTSKLGLYSGQPPTGDWILSSSDFTAERRANQTPSYVEFLNARPVPSPALLPGLIGMGVAAWRKRKSEQAAESDA